MDSVEFEKIKKKREELNKRREERKKRQSTGKLTAEDYETDDSVFDNGNVKNCKSCGAVIHADGKRLVLQERTYCQDCGLEILDNCIAEMEDLYDDLLEINEDNYILRSFESPFMFTKGKTLRFEGYIAKVVDSGLSPNGFKTTIAAPRKFMENFVGEVEL